ncbi:MAG TPA: pre-peptidase C-terminal domain-containing protein, partial [Rhodanobacteraceae bacterium]|nr:pre-peptidase C-terminal domain-containing protein [Rhodanobacteraceae bacterium]
MKNRSGVVRRGPGLLSCIGVLLIGSVSHAATPAPNLLSIDAPRHAAKDPPPPAESLPRAPAAPLAQSPVVRPSFNIDPSLPAEVEPNGTPAQATPLALSAGGAAHVVGNVYPNGDLDFYSFTAAAGDRVYVAMQASASASGSNDGVLELYASDGTTLVEGDEDDGSFGSLSPSIAGATLPAAGTYYLRVRHSAATAQLRPYHLYFQLRSGTPVAETEPNDASPGPALPAGGWVSGEIASATDVDFHSISLNAGDTVFLSLDQDPERNGDANLRLGLGVFDGQILVVNDNGA